MERKMTIEEPGIYREDYQMRMLRDNRIEGLLPVRGRGADGVSCYDYDVSGKVSVKAMYEKNNIGAEELRAILGRLLSVLRETERHLLNIHRILLEPEYIFYDEGEYFFCYYPPGKGNLWEEFHGLTEYLVKQADYGDKECVRLVFLLHKETMEENYSLEKLIGECLREPETEKGARPGEDGQRGAYTGEGHQTKADELWGDVNYGIYDGYEAVGDRITERELAGAIREETASVWTPVKRFFNRRKKSRWGDWDGLYIEEEEL